MTTTCISPFSDGLYFDCNIWVPGDEYHELTSSSSGNSEEIDKESYEEYASEDNFSEESVEKQKYVEKPSLNEILRQKQCTKKLSEGFRNLCNESGKAKTSSLIKLAQKAGFAPSKKEENNFLETCGEKASYQEFTEWLLSIAHLEDSVNELSRFFKHFDHNKSGKLSRNQITFILKHLGDHLTNEEINFLLKSANQNSNEVDYSCLAKMILINK
ncbi:uncharacterized protein LOC128884163 isoform X2 [Hylaeus volcanicus]|uniref:uncharacterized protein LOC128884163 isoform X2 n=1 Tax=Hylaeus volcanicus TaxID=313075 RepID=UPI0023B8138B|nr:uncharacterized protein LOC128884163 isoform X2 [Hylaeus volcanicus]XP_053993261.1 uncharacterized protein LOC128884163 isoform X2 [Hylaeus volcanicus]